MALIELSWMSLWNCTPLLKLQNMLPNVIQDNGHQIKLHIFKSTHSMMYNLYNSLPHGWAKIKFDWLDSNASYCPWLMRRDYLMITWSASLFVFSEICPPVANHNTSKDGSVLYIFPSLCDVFLLHFLSW